MSYTSAAILLAIQSLPTFHEDRNLPQKLEQIVTISEQLSHAVTTAERWTGARTELAAMGVAIAWMETKMSHRIQQGNCNLKIGECDRGKAVGLWQAHESSLSNPKLHPLLAGTDAYSTGLQAREAVRAIILARGLCRSLYRKKDDWIGYTFGAYAGRKCTRSLPDMKERVAVFERVRTKLYSYRPES